MPKKSIVIDGKVYVPEDESVQKKSAEGKEYVIVRTYTAGVFAGYLESRKDREVVLSQARRLWYWSGAASLSQLALEGVKNPGECKFPQEVPSVTLLEAIEILPCSVGAKESIDSVVPWKE